MFWLKPTYQPFSRYGLVNTAILLLGIWEIRSRVNPIYLLGLATMPVIYWYNESLVPGIAVVIFAVAVWKKQLVIGAAIFLVAILLTNGIIHSGWKIDKEQLVMYQSDSASALTKTTWTFQTDLWRRGVPFRVSQIVHNPIITVVNKAFRNTTDFWYLPNIYQTILLANLYLIILGIAYLKDKRVWIIFSLFLIVVGLALHAGKNASIYALVPLFLYLAGRGAYKSNIKIYIGLWILQILILGWR